jgi:tetraacyldisaccharide 4'-kinase
VIVGESRYAAGRVAERKFQPQLHILDDGFQHRSLVRNFDIVLMTERDFDDRLLPSGRLREPLSSLRRADAIVLPAGLAVDHPALRQKLIWRIERELVLPSLPSAPVVFCGIARPEQFFAQVRATGITPAAEIIFRDHHAYDLDDIQALVGVRRDLQAGGFLTTEKDAINLAPEQHCLEPLAIAELRLTLDRPTDVMGAILARINDGKPRS